MQVADRLFKSVLVAGVIVFIGGTAAQVQAGQNKGNGCCYDTPAPPGTGKYCGKGSGKGTGEDCDCNLFVADPHPLDGLDIIGTGPMTGVKLPNVGDPSYTIQTWNGSSFVTIGAIPPDSVFLFLVPVARFRVANIAPTDTIDLSNDAVFPMVVYGPSGTYTKHEFASTQPLQSFSIPLASGFKVFWYGGSGPFVLQQGPSGSGPWTSSPPTDQRDATLPAGAANAFIRVVGYSGGTSAPTLVAPLPPAVAAPAVTGPWLLAVCVLLMMIGASRVRLKRVGRS